MSTVYEAEVVPNSIFALASTQLTIKQKSFIYHYLQTRNGTQAARLAGYAGDDNTLAQIAYENLRKGDIVAELTKLLHPLASAAEVLARLSHHSRASISDVLTDDGSFDLATAKANHSDDLIKKLKIKRRVETDRNGNITEFIDHELELHDAQAATVHLAKHHGLLAERTESVNLNIDLNGHDLSEILMGALSDAQLGPEST